VLPCHAAHTLPGLTFDNVADRPLGEIWHASDAFNRFRGQDWMPAPCRTCPEREVDFGGCRCQAHALTGDLTLTDPACQLSPHHDIILRARATAAGSLADASPSTSGRNGV
jgi:pyrroloquinoline quinone biosynthesis protein E